MMSHLCNRCVRELLILARTWFAFGLPSKPGVIAEHNDGVEGQDTGVDDVVVVRVGVAEVGRSWRQRAHLRNTSREGEI
jgi:hypothetical protein